MVMPRYTALFDRRMSGASVPISDVPAQLVTDLYSFPLRCTLFIIDPGPYRMGYRIVGDQAGSTIDRKFAGYLNR